MIGGSIYTGFETCLGLRCPWKNELLCTNEFGPKCPCCVWI